jgi:hypothetical protein
MRITKYDNGYVMWLSAKDIYNWAHRAGARGAVLPRTKRGLPGYLLVKSQALREC